MWFNGKLIVVAVCCLSHGVFGSVPFRNREVSSKDTDSAGKSDNEESSTSSASEKDNDFGDWNDLLGNNGNGDSVSSIESGGSSNNVDTDNPTNNDTESDDNDFVNGLAPSNTDSKSKNNSHNVNKDTESSSDFNWTTDFTDNTKNQTDQNSKKHKKKKTTTPTKENGSTNKNNTDSNSSDWSANLNTDDSHNWPNDQGWNAANSTSNSSESTPSGTNSTSSASNTNSSVINNWLNGMLDKINEKNSSSKENTTTLNKPNILPTEKPPNASTTSTSDGANYSTGYWIPIFNFANDFYFMTNKGYAKLVNFPAPVIYSFKPISVKNTEFKPTVAQQLGQEEEIIIENFFGGESSFADCYVDTTMGNLIPYSYFGSWVIVFNLGTEWHLQTYNGFVLLDLNSDEAPVTYEFVPLQYQYSKVDSISTESSQQTAEDAGLASWSEPVVVED